MTYDYANGESPLDSNVAELPAIRLQDFLAYMPDHRYIFRPTRDQWPASSVDARVNWPKGKNGQPMKPSNWLDRNATVEQMTWIPGEPELIEDRLIDGGGWIEHPGVTAFNLYRPPRPDSGDASKARPWVDHLRSVYPDDSDHLIAWLAHRVQRPGEKINHAIVMGGVQGIGKDTILEPVKRAIGPWNMAEVSPLQLMGRFNGFVKAVIMRVSESRDQGDVDRYKLYDHLKTYTAAPPDVLRCDEKHAREYPVPNVCGVIVTTNHETDGIYLPADDRRHYVAWSPRTREDFTEEYWRKLWHWYDEGGYGHVAAFLAAVDLSDFNPKAPPRKTPAFWRMVDAQRAPEDAELADVIDGLRNPNALTIEQIRREAQIMGYDDFAEALKDRRTRKAIAHRINDAGYVQVRNDTAQDGLWVIGGRRQVVYAKRELGYREQVVAAHSIMRS